MHAFCDSPSCFQSESFCFHPELIILPSAGVALLPSSTVDPLAAQGSDHQQTETLNGPVKVRGEVLLSPTEPLSLPAVPHPRSIVQEIDIELSRLVVLTAIPQLVPRFLVRHVHGVAIRQEIE